MGTSSTRTLGVSNNYGKQDMRIKTFSSGCYGFRHLLVVLKKRGSLFGTLNRCQVKLRLCLFISLNSITNRHFEH